MSDTEHKYSGNNVRGEGHASPYPVSRLGAPMSLVDMAKAIESASDKVAMRTNAQLEVIVEQMKALQERAREIIEQASPEHEHELENWRTRKRERPLFRCR